MTNGGRVVRLDDLNADERRVVLALIEAGQSQKKGDPAMDEIAKPSGKSATPEQTLLTPELAAKLLSNPHPRQRRQARNTAAEYARRIKEGRWKLVPDPIMVDPEGRMFNGGHRCQAVIAANRSIPVFIMWDADPELFDVIDVGRFRSPYQFISDKDATARASAARVTLWYQHRFDRPLAGRTIGFDLQEILDESDRRAESFDAVTGASRSVYDYTGIPRSVSLAAFSIAFEMGYETEINAFVDGIRDPHYLDADDPARLLAERFRKQEHRSRRREIGQDWTLLVYTFNLHLEGRKLSKLILSDVWPRVAETTAEYRRRQNAIHQQRRTAGIQGAGDQRRKRPA